jgi:hypothetical protein
MRVSQNDLSGGGQFVLAQRVLVRLALASFAMLVLPPAAVVYAADSPARLGAPLRLTPPPKDAAAGVSPTAPDAAEAHNGIRVDTLAPLDPDWAGPLTEADGGFPLDLWRGAPVALVTAVVPRIAATGSPTLQSLTRRLLLTNAKPPDDAVAGRDRISFMALRADRLVAAGQIAAARALLAIAPASGDLESIDRRSVDLALLDNDGKDACDRVGEDVRRYEGVWWRRALIACQAMSGDNAKASLGLDLLHEQKAPADEAFDTLVEAVGGRRAKLDRLSDPSPFDLTLLAAAKLPLPNDALAAASPAVLRAWAGADGAPAPQRLVAGERAAALGAISLADLRSLYGDAEFTPDERAAAIGRAPLDQEARGHALLYTAAESQNFGPTRAETLQAMLAAARHAGDFVFVARVAEPLLLEVRPSRDLAWFAPNAARALLAAGRNGEAQAWIAVASAESMADLFIPWRLALGRDGPSWNAKLFAAALAETAKSDDDSGPRRAALALTLLGGFDEAVAAADWASLAAPLPVVSLDLPGAPVWFELPRAAAAKRLGETVLLALVTAGEGDRLTAQPARLARTIAALREVGLEGEARSIALEAALDAGL